MQKELEAETCLFTLQFIDDQVVCAGNKQDLACMARKLTEEYDELDL